jgi:hypothetical protein
MLACLVRSASALATIAASPLPDHDGEDIENWEAFTTPSRQCTGGIARIRLFVGSMMPSGAEHWEKDLIP